MHNGAAIDAIVAAETWNARVALIRKVPESFGVAHHQAIFAAIAKAVYIPHLAPDFAYIHWRDDYELDGFEAAYDLASALTNAFSETHVDRLAEAIAKAPVTLRIFRTILGLTVQEFAASTAIVADREGWEPVTDSRIKGIEGGRRPKAPVDRICAMVIDEAMRGVLFGAPTDAEVRPKTAKPDTDDGWATVRQFAVAGVPLAVFLHQRHYGGAFRQLLDATSTKRGNLLEDSVSSLLMRKHVPFVQTGSSNQEEIADRFGLTVKPAPDFVMYDRHGALRAILECKGANDGGTARDKASRFKSLRSEGVRLGGVPLFAVLAGLGWRRVADALGPVVEATDGRVFTLATLSEMATVFPITDLVGQDNKDQGPI